MARDARLDLGRYIRNPFNKNSANNKRLNFDDLFRSKPETGDYPWNPSRFNETDLLKRAMTRKVTLNPDLNFVGNAPFFDDNKEVTSQYELFEGLGRFHRPDYDFEEGRPNTTQRPQDQPDFNPRWVEAYKLSPTLKPDAMAKNPMPRMRNPDPNGYLMAKAESQAKNEAEGNKSVADLLAEPSKEPTKKEDEQGQEVANDTEKDTGVEPMTT
jgi:hypothetical protein